jgi:hypothetical protein
MGKRAHTFVVAMIRDQLLIFAQATRNAVSLLRNASIEEILRGLT